MSRSIEVTIAALNISKIYRPRRRLSIRRREEEFVALQPMSFIAHSGEAVGVLGKNGSGKSTLLNLLAGNESPSTGKVLVSEPPTLLGVSAALQPHLSGLANVRLGLLAMGLSNSEAENLRPKVIEWSGLSTAALRPMKTYSSGMQARLKFAIATAIHREILLVDEALSTGDATFARKAERRMNEFLENSGTVMIVSHAPGTIEKYCDRAIWIHEGELIADDTTRRTARYYKAWTRYMNKGNEKAADRIITQMRDEFEPTKPILDSDAAKFLDCSRN